MMAAEKHLIDIDQIASGAMVFRFSDQGVILDYMNNALCQMLHCEKEDIECQDFNKPLRRVHPVDARRLWPIFLNLPNTGKMKCDFRFRDYLTEQWCWLSVNGTYAQDEKGQCAYCIFTDITQQQESIIREHSLLRCLQWIVAEQNWQENMDHVLEEVMKQYQADRAYIFEFDWDNQLMSNTWEAVAPGVIPEKKNLQNMPVELIDYWLPYFTEGRPVFIEDLEQIKNDASRHNEYKVLAAQDIDSLMTIPILNNKNSMPISV